MSHEAHAPEQERAALVERLRSATWLIDLSEEFRDQLLLEAAEALAAPCAECARLREELADYRNTIPLSWRDVDPTAVCERCHGSGSLIYANTSTWQGGCGGNAMRRGVCDRCWGSGETTPWLSHRDALGWRTRAEAAEARATAAEQELAGIDAVMARTPALDKPTRRENVAHAIATAKRADEAERKLEAAKELDARRTRDYHSLAAKLDDAEAKLAAAEQRAAQLREALEQIRDDPHVYLIGHAQQLAKNALTATPQPSEPKS